MSKIYVPDGVDGVCYINSESYITVLTTNNPNTYNNGYRVFKRDYTITPVTSYGVQTCDNFNTYTHDIWFRNDLLDLFLLIGILCTFMFLMFKLFLFPWFGHFRR